MKTLLVIFAVCLLAGCSRPIAGEGLAAMVQACEKAGMIPEYLDTGTVHFTCVPAQKDNK